MSENLAETSGLEALFEKVLTEINLAEERDELPDPKCYLDRYPELAARLEAEFRRRKAWARLKGLLVSSPVGRPAANADAGPQTSDGAVRLPAFLPVGTRFANFEIVARLGHGGMGIVYRARQFIPDRTEPLREVALKLIRTDQLEWLVDKERSEWIDNFYRETKVIAELGDDARTAVRIVPLFEVGMFQSQPYFTMPLITGGSLAERLREVNELAPTEAADRRLRNQRANAQLLAQVVRAVDFAHRHRIVHRDLKPANILLDAEGQPFVSDFGLAKRVAVERGQTKSEDLVGSRGYIAPELATGGSRALTTAVDIYSLGVILYEMLTGRLPFKGEYAVETLLMAVHNEAAPPRSLDPRLSRDLETICLKCLEKEPARRFRSAAELADDLENWLAGRPLGYARRPKAMEQVWHWCRRNPIPTAASGLAVAALVVATVLAILFGHHKQTEARKAEKVSDYLMELLEVNETLGFQGPAFSTRSNRTHSLTVPSVLDRGTQMATNELADQPGVQAKLLAALGNLYRSRGAYQAAMPLLESALAIRRRISAAKEDVAASLYYLAWLHHERGNYDEAYRLYREALETCGGEGAANSLAASIMFNLGWLFTDMHEYVSGEEYFRKILANRGQQMGADGRDVAIAHVGLAINLSEQERHWGALQHITNAWLSFRKQQQVGNSTVEILNKHLTASALKSWGNYKGAADLLREALLISRVSLGQKHPYVTINLTALGLVLERMDLLDEAAEQYRECLEIAKNTKGYDHSRIAQQTFYLADLLARMGRYREGTKLFEELLRERRDRLGGDHRLVADALASFGQFIGKHGKPGEAEAALREALRIFRKQESHQFTRFYELCLNSLAVVLERKGEPVEAEQLLNESLLLMRNRLGGAYRKQMAPALRTQACALVRQGRYAEGEKCLHEAHSIDRNVTDEGPRDLVYLAGIYALTAAAVEHDVSLSPTERRGRAEQYTSQVIRLLRRAHQAGYFKDPAHVEQVKKNEDFESLRSREDFMRFLSEVEGGREPGAK